MKKKIFCIVFSLLVVVFCNSTYASQPANPTDSAYSFDIVYTGDIIEDEDKNATVVLQATEGKVYSKVRIKVEAISGPATPTILAYDSNGIGYNIAELGAWGPESGFAVGGTFKNETPIVATYPEAGTYVSRISLLDLNNNEQVITSKEFTITVLPKTPTNIGGTTNNTVDNVIEEIPQTGTSIWVYLSVIIGIMAVVYIILRVKNK